MTANMAAALAKAQAEMGKAHKDATNPHFRSKYADLASVREACFPALNANGIAVVQQVEEGERRDFMVTRFLHSGGESIECRIPLIVQKQDMQGYGSAMTYARRYGLMSLAGIAPEDDDGNAAAAAAPDPAQEATATRDRIKKAIAREGTVEGLAEMWKAEWRHIKALPQPMQMELTKDKDDRKLALSPTPQGVTADGDSTPY